MRTTIRNPWAAPLLLGALLVGLVATPALAAAPINGTAAYGRGSGTERILASVVVRRPDGRIRLGSTGVDGGQVSTYHGPWLGNRIYYATGAGQAAILPQRAAVVGSFVTFDISIQNNGNRTDRFKVKATGAADGWTVTYSRGATNITSAVVAGTYRTPSLAPGATYLIHAKVTLNSVGSASVSVVRLVTIRSVSNPTKIDAVKFGFLWNSGVPSGG